MMTRKIFIPLLLLFGAANWWGCSNQKSSSTDGEEANLWLPTTYELNNLINVVDLKRDVSNANLYEVRLLRASLLAHNGEWLMESDMYKVFGAQEWYQEFEMEAMEMDGVPIAKLNKEQKVFLEKLNAREAELLKNNFSAPEGYRVNIRNLANPFLLDTLDINLQKALAKNGFVIVPNTYEQFFHVYENNDYHEFPSFVTTDMYMQLFHIYFGYLLRTLEEERLIPLLQNFGIAMHHEMETLINTMDDEVIRKAAAHNMAFFAIGNALLTGEKSLSVPEEYRLLVDEEIDKAREAKPDFSEYLGYPESGEVVFPYDLFRPRGHYTRTEALKRYFLAMMWYQTTPVCLDNADELKPFILQGYVLNKRPQQMKQYQAITTPIQFIIGEPDNLSVLQIAQEMKRGGFRMEELMGGGASLQKFQAIMRRLAGEQNRIKPLFEKTCRDKINLMPQRYLVDAEILLGLIDAHSEVTKRGKPMGLDIFAAFGSKTAENILLNELKEGEKWEKYPSLLNEMAERVKETDWNKTMYNKWMETLVALETANERYPYFMQTPQWGKKNLNAALASWAELKHDAILYGEQPCGAECGGGGLPEPITIGYVEPNLVYWNKVIELLDLTYGMLKNFDLLTEDIESKHNSMREQAFFLRNVSEKELRREPLSEVEYNQISYIGASFEWLTLDLLKSRDQALDSWFLVEGPDRQVSVVADVFTANGDNNPDKMVLYEATGYVDHIYVVVEIEGRLYLTRGGVFSYHEFGEPLTAPRLTDEEWQRKLKANPRYGVPSWMNELILPTSKFIDNERFFYSGGC